MKHFARIPCRKLTDDWSLPSWEEAWFDSWSRLTNRALSRPWAVVSNSIVLINERTLVLAYLLIKTVLL